MKESREVIEKMLKRSKLDNIQPWVHLWAWGIFLGFILLLLVAFFIWRDVNVWVGFEASGELRKQGYAERIYESSVFRTRANTWSNMFYVIVGLYAIFLSLRDRSLNWKEKDGYLVNTAPLGILYGVACCYLGFGSGLFHASLTHIGQQLDVAAMYSPLVVLWGINLGRWIPRFPGKAEYPTWPVISLLIIIACAVLFIYKWELSSGTVLPLLILGVLCCIPIDVISRRRNLCLWWVLTAFITLVLGVTCRQMGIARLFSGPDTIFQGHSFWHLFTAGTLASMYLYYRSEEILPNTRGGVDE